MSRRGFVKAASLAGLGYLTGFPSFHIISASIMQSQPSHHLFIDADTANEIDDLYAIVRALLEPTFMVVGLSSAQWNHRLSPPDTVSLSQKINEDIVSLMGRKDVPTTLGAEMIMGKPWGGDEPRDSPAAQAMIAAARTLPSEEKLTIACLGAVTNLASAVKLAPDIASRIRCYMLAGRFYADRACGTKTNSTFVTTSTPPTSSSTLRNWSSTSCR